ncbi:MAG: alpha/beta fold hydrolase [Deltaproteobacteria bacterium]|nr:alpha/beta fold hydrolase [Deltaproteobacteria bacterium]MBK8714718.1 alpha/beta fold hydrolase [Deltaproteobacteria bacterium]MBP7289234.1 alpha/beta fold hydrolase [Nannocystaceae bacterium]
MSELLPCVEVEPAGVVRADASVIWLHGLGADGHDFEPVVPLLGCTGVRFVFPHAPAIPVTINGGMVMPAWYDIRSLDFDDDRREDLAQVEASAREIVGLVERERARRVPPSRIVLAGFSQGAAMAVHVAVRYRDALAGLLVLSGYLVAPARFDAEASAANRGIPVLQCHGRFDDVVPIAAGRDLYDTLHESAAEPTDVHWREYPMGHEVCPEQLDLIGAWLRERLPPLP